TDFTIKKLALRRERTAFRKPLQRRDRHVNSIEPAVGGLVVSLRQPSVSFGNIPLGGNFDAGIPSLHLWRPETFCLPRISFSAARNGLPVPSFIASSPR